MAAARAALASGPRRWREFERLLATAQRYAALREEIVAPFTLGWPVLRCRRRSPVARPGYVVAGVSGAASPSLAAPGSWPPKTSRSRASCSALSDVFSTWGL